MKRLIIFDKASAQVIGRHNAWEDNWEISEWATFDSTTQDYCIVDKSTKDIVGDKVLQAENGQSIYVDKYIVERKYEDYLASLQSIQTNDQVN